MNLLESFPEIDVFFKQCRFSQEELDQLRLTIEIQYKKADLKRSALNLVKLELAKYDRLELGHLNIPIPDSTQPFNVESKSKLKLTILDWAEMLQYKPEYVIRLLSQKNIYKETADPLSKQEYDVMKEAFHFRIKAIKTKQKQDEINLKLITPVDYEILKKRKPIPEVLNQPFVSESNDVYSQIGKFGVKRIFYNRSRY